MNVIEELSSNNTLLTIVDSVEYNSAVLNMTKSFSGKKICYVTLNKTFNSLKDIFVKNDIDVNNIIFIDAISKNIQNVPETDEGCYFVSSPSALTELSLVISKILNYNFDYIIFDSLTNLLVFQKEAPIAKFVSNLVNKIRQTSTKAVFIALKIKEQEELINEAGMFVDKVLVN